MSPNSSLGLRNPILPGFNPDPSLLRVGHDYFLCTSTFEYFPGLPIYHSTDLVNWKLIGHVLTRRSRLDLRECKPGGGIYAPTIRYHKGRFYATVSVTHRGGEYKDPEVSRLWGSAGVVLIGRHRSWLEGSMFGPTISGTRTRGVIQFTMMSAGSIRM